MADKFYDGMPNVNEALNEMDRAFAAGPYSALPLTGGNLTGPVTSTSYMALEGAFAAKGYLTIGPVTTENKHKIYANVFQFGEILQLGRSGAANPCFSFNASSGAGGWAYAESVLFVGKNSITARSANLAGTLNVSGADYAEYLIKGLLCGTIVPGQIIGIDADGRLADKWDLAVSFAVKSTNPCVVGGDTWASHLGPRPIAPVRQDDDTDEEWVDALAAVQGAQHAFDIELEHARQQVDRIAFAGQVPVNLQGAAPGQFIVPVQDGEGIGGLAIDESDITLRQYMRAIGRVIAIEDDGRARIIVKVA